MDDAGIGAAEAQFSFLKQEINDIDIALLAPIDELAFACVADDEQRWRFGCGQAFGECDEGLAAIIAH